MSGQRFRGDRFGVVDPHAAAELHGELALPVAEAPDVRVGEVGVDVGERMKADRTKNRVTVYYLLAEHFGKLDLFVR